MEVVGTADSGAGIQWMVSYRIAQLEKLGGEVIGICIHPAGR